MNQNDHGRDNHQDRGQQNAGQQDGQRKTQPMQGESDRNRQPGSASGSDRAPGGMPEAGSERQPTQQDDGSGQMDRPDAGRSGQPGQQQQDARQGGQSGAPSEGRNRQPG